MKQIKKIEMIYVDNYGNWFDGGSDYKTITDGEPFVATRIHRDKSRIEVYEILRFKINEIIKTVNLLSEAKK